MAIFAIHIACAPPVLSLPLNTCNMATPSFSREEILDFIDEWSDNSHDGISSGEEEYLDRVE